MKQPNYARELLKDHDDLLRVAQTPPMLNFKEGSLELSEQKSHFPNNQ